MPLYSQEIPGVFQFKRLQKLCGNYLNMNSHQNFSFSVTALENLYTRITYLLQKWSLKIVIEIKYFVHVWHKLVNYNLQIRWDTGKCQSLTELIIKNIHHFPPQKIINIKSDYNWQRVQARTVFAGHLTCIRKPIRFFWGNYLLWALLSPTISYWTHNILGFSIIPISPT